MHHDPTPPPQPRFDPLAMVGGDIRREEMRFCVAEPGQVVIASAQTATIADESYCGLGVLVDDRPDVVPGQTVTVDCAGRTAPAEVMNLTAMRDGRWRLGLKWTAPGGPFVPDGHASDGHP